MSSSNTAGIYYHHQRIDPILSRSYTDDPDSFIIGDRVWVQGIKPGKIAYIGEVRFANGDWAGIVLDKPEGKNDGSVHGVRYFQCEPYRGLFTRLHRLSRYPLDINNNANNLQPIDMDADKNEFRRQLRSSDGRVTTTVTRVTKGPVRPCRPTRQVITTITTTTTTLTKPKSALKSTNFRSDLPKTPHHVHF